MTLSVKVSDNVLCSSRCCLIFWIVDPSACTFVMVAVNFMIFRWNVAVDQTFIYLLTVPSALIFYTIDPLPVSWLSNWDSLWPRIVKTVKKSSLMNHSGWFLFFCQCLLFMQFAFGFYFVVCIFMKGGCIMGPSKMITFSISSFFSQLQMQKVLLCV